MVSVQIYNLLITIPKFNKFWELIFSVTLRETHLMIKPDLNWWTDMYLKSLFSSLTVNVTVTKLTSFIKACFPTLTGVLYICYIHLITFFFFIKEN